MFYKDYFLSQRMKFLVFFATIALSAHAFATIVNKSGNITANAIWSDTIYITGNISVNNATLTVKEGAKIFFKTGNTLSALAGNLDFEGSNLNPIFIFGGTGKSISTYGKLIMKFCHIDSCQVGFSGGAQTLPGMDFEDNVLTHGSIGWANQMAIIRRNYIHQSVSNNSITVACYSAGSIIQDNIMSGGTWVTGGFSGSIRGNVFISMAVPTGSVVDSNTHELMFGIQNNTILERNIFIGKCYGAIMPIGDNNGSNTLIRNNTFDLRGSGQAVYFHMTTQPPNGVVVRNNIFMRCGGLYDEQNIANSITYTDYNLYSSVNQRYFQIAITGKTVGTDGYDKHALPFSGTLLPADVVVNPDSDYPIPYSDSEMLYGTKTFVQALTLYRNNYSLKPGSPGIDAGAPQDSLDSLVSDKKCDIGAMEYHDVSLIKSVYLSATEKTGLLIDPMKRKVTFSTRNMGTIIFCIFDVAGRIKWSDTIKVTKPGLYYRKFKLDDNGIFVARMEQGGQIFSCKFSQTSHH